MSLTVPFLPLRLRSDDVREDNVFMYVLVVLFESTGGILIIQQLFNSVKLSKEIPKWLLLLTYTTGVLCSGKVERSKFKHLPFNVGRQRNKG